MAEWPASPRRRVEAGIRMKYITYILKSQIAPKTYVGHTDSMDRRLSEHNNGKSIFTRRYKPWSILYTEEFTHENESIKKEEYFKSGAGRRWIKKTLFKS